MKYFICMLTFLSMMSAMVYGQDKKDSVLLGTDSERKVIECPGFCNVFVSKGEQTDDDSWISLEIENLHSTNVYLLFGHSFSERDLKKQPVKIIFDKIYGATSREIQKCEGVESHQIASVSPSEKKKLNIYMGGAEKKTIRIPIYVALSKEPGFLSKQKYIIQERVILEIKVIIEQKPDEEFIKMTEEYGKLQEELSKITQFCTNIKHKPRLQDQEAPFVRRIDNLKKDVDKKIKTTYPSNSIYQKLLDLKKQLDSIQLSDYEGDCGKHVSGSTGLRCKYCNSSLNDIYNKLNNYYIRRWNKAPEWRNNKSTIINDAKMLYNCCSKHKSHSLEWKKAGRLREDIKIVYERIIK